MSVELTLGRQHYSRMHDLPSQVTNISSVRMGRMAGSKEPSIEYRIFERYKGWNSRTLQCMSSYLLPNQLSITLLTYISEPCWCCCCVSLDTTYSHLQLHFHFHTHNRCLFAPGVQVAPPAGIIQGRTRHIKYIILFTSSSPCQLSFQSHIYQRQG